MEKNNLEIYKNLTIKDVEDALLSLAEKKTNKRNFTIATGKQGVLSYLKLLYEKAGLTKEVITSKLEKVEKELLEGCYVINETGITYYKTN